MNDSLLTAVLVAVGVLVAIGLLCALILVIAAKFFAVKVCPSGAIFNNNGVACVDPAKCTGCGLCAKACPNLVIRLIPADAGTVVTCNNKEKGAIATKQCRNSCIGCKKCELHCHNGAIKVVENYAHIDYTKCDGCHECEGLCPRHTIKHVDFKQAQ